MVQVDYDLVLESLDIGINEELYLDCNIAISHSSQNGVELDRVEIPVSLELSKDMEMMIGLDEEVDSNEEELELNVELLKRFRDVITNLIIKAEERLND